MANGKTMGYQAASEGCFLRLRKAFMTSASLALLFSLPAFAQELDQGTRNQITSEYLAAENRFNAGQYEVALEHLNRVESLNTGSTLPTAQDLRVRVLIRMADWAQAERELDELYQLPLSQELLVSAADYRRMIARGQSIEPLQLAASEISQRSRYDWVVFDNEREQGSWSTALDVALTLNSDGVCNLSMLQTSESARRSKVDGRTRRATSSYSLNAQIDDSMRLRMYYGRNFGDGYLVALEVFESGGWNSLELIEHSSFSDFTGSESSRSERQHRFLFAQGAANEHNPLFPPENGVGAPDSMGELIEQISHVCGSEFMVQDNRG